MEKDREKEPTKCNYIKVAIVPLVMYTASFVTSFLMKYLNNKAGRKMSFLFGTIVGKLKNLVLTIDQATHVVLSIDRYFLQVSVPVFGFTSEGTNTGKLTSFSSTTGYSLLP